MTVHQLSRTGQLRRQTPEPQVGKREDVTPRWPEVVGEFVTFALGVFTIITGSWAVLSVFVVANVLHLTAAPSDDPQTADQAPGCLALTTRPAW